MASCDLKRTHNVAYKVTLSRLALLPALAWPLSALALAPGSRVIARDSKGYWYRAQTPDERREPSEQFRVRFTEDAERVEPSRIDKKFTKTLIVQLKAYT